MKVQQLECGDGQTMNIVGMTALDGRGRPAAVASQTCPYLNNLLTTARTKCSGRRQCQLTAREFGVSKDQCPGVSAVNFRVNCVNAIGSLHT